MLVRLDDEQRTLLPARMRNADDGSDPHAGAACGDILEVDRADPFSARLDHVPGSVGDPQETVAVDRCDVAGVEPAVPIDDVLFVAEIAANDPRSPNLERARGLAVPANLASRFVDNPEFDTELEPALPRPDH